MASSVKKVTIPNKDFPAIQSTGEYMVRFRVISKDKVKISAWSTPQSISVPAFPASNTTPDTSQGSITSDNIGISIGWNAKNLATKTSFDIYLKWTYPNGTDDKYKYSNTVNANTYYATIPNNVSGRATNVNVIVQQETLDKPDLDTPDTNIDNNPILIFAGSGTTAATIIGLPTSFDGGVIA